MAQYANTSYVSGNENGFGLPFAKKVYSARLAATTDTSLTVPGASGITETGGKLVNKYLAVFQYEDAASVFVANGAAAAAPAGAGFAATTSELNPPAKMVKAGDVLHFYAIGADTDMTVAFYEV